MLAAVLRGFDAANMRPAAWLITACAELLEANRSPAAKAELAEALARHRTGEDLVSSAVSAAFHGRGFEQPDAAYARWWLASRRCEADRHVSAGAVEDARLQALAAADPSDGKPAAMMMEAAARAAGELVIASHKAVSSVRSPQDRSVRVYRAIYRGLFLGGLMVLGLFNLSDLGHAAANLVGASKEKPFRQVIAFLLTAGAVACVSGAAKAIARTHGRQAPEWTGVLEVLALAPPASSPRRSCKGRARRRARLAPPRAMVGRRRHAT